MRQADNLTNGLPLTVRTRQNNPKTIQINNVNQLPGGFELTEAMIVTAETCIAVTPTNSIKMPCVRLVMYFPNALDQPSAGKNVITIPEIIIAVIQAPNPEIAITE